MARLFVALDLSGADGAIAPLRAPIEGIRWAAAEALHVTLRFVGEVDDRLGAELATRLAEVRGAPLDLSLRGVGLRGRPPRLAFAGVAPTPPLLALHAAVEAAIVAGGVAPDLRAFHPHVTVARFRGGARRALREWAERHRDFASPPLPVDAFHLVESRSGPAGAVHHRIATYALSPGDPAAASHREAVR